MAESAAYLVVLCDRWIDEVRGERCALEEGHEGPCRPSDEVRAHNG